MNKMILKAVLSNAIVLAYIFSAEAQDSNRSVQVAEAVENVSINRVAKEEMEVAFDLDLSHLKLKNNKACLLTPVLVSGDRSFDLPAVGLYGRGSFIQYQRNGLRTLSDSEKMTYSVKSAPRTVNYSVNVPWQEWMDGAELQIRTDYFGCRNCEEGSDLTKALGGYTSPEFSFVPEFLFVRPEAEVTKTRTISGRAFIDFEQGKTAVVESYHSNAAELAKIRAGVDSVRTDPDITINGITLKGFASPEGPYALNEKLAKVRTEAIRDYVRNLYKLDEGLFTVSFVPENWEGLRSYVSSSNLTNRKEILELIDDNVTFQNQDAKEWRIKSVYKEDYAILLAECYPFLRRTDYRIDYTVRSYATADELETIFRKRPQNLSLEEFYLLASKYSSGGPEFNGIFLEAAKVYPDDPVANLNAAMALMQSGDYDNVQDFLLLAGEGGDALYANGLLLALIGDYEGAEDYFAQARSAGVRQATAALEQLHRRKEVLFLQ